MAITTFHMGTLSQILRDRGCPRCQAPIMMMVTHMAYQCSNGHRLSYTGEWFDELEKEEIQMLPKDLLEDLEEGNRTSEFVTTDVDAKPSVEPQEPSNSWFGASGGLAQALGGLQQNIDGLRNQQLAQQQFNQYANQGMWRTTTSNGTGSNILW